MLMMATACNQLTVSLEGPTQQWMSRHYPTYLALEVFQKQHKLRHSEEMLGEIWLDRANSTTARSHCPSVDLLMLILSLSADASYSCFATRLPRRRTDPLHSLHTLQQHARPPRHGPFGLDRGLQCLDRTDAQLLRDRHHLDNYGLLAVLRSHGHHRAHAPPAHKSARRAGNRSIEFSSNPAFDPTLRTLAVLTVYLSPTPLFGPDPPLTSVGTISPAQLGHLAYIFVVKVLHVVPFRHAEHAKTFLRGIRGIGTFKTLREHLNSDGGTDTAMQPPLGAHCRLPPHWTRATFAAARSPSGQ
jgi:hypothetical protein